MNVALRAGRMTREQFLLWRESQERRYEFDGFQPVATTGASLNHNRITLNIHRSLHARLRGSGCEALGTDAGVATAGDAVRYPDALVSCEKGPGDSRLAPGVVVVFEVLSPSSGRIDRIAKLVEYRAVPSIRRYVIVEQSSVGLSVFERAGGEADWTATALTGDAVLRMPEIGIEIPVIEFYEAVDLPEASTA